MEGVEVEGRVSSEKRIQIQIVLYKCVKSSKYDTCILDTLFEIYKGRSEIKIWLAMTLLYDR